MTLLGFIGVPAQLSALRAASSSTASSSVRVSHLGERAATLSWDAASCGLGPYKVRHGTWATRTVSKPRIQLHSLSPGSEYNVRIQSIGGTDVASARFTTTGTKRTQMEAESEAGAEDSAEEEPAPLTELSRLEIRVGRIVECERHPDADSLYVEKVDMGAGEEGMRTIVSGLVKFVDLDEMVGKDVLVLANLKPRAMRGVTSAGMLLCASNEDHSRVDPLRAPEGAKLGELVTFDGHRSAPVDPGNRAGKAFDRVAAGLKTDADGVALYEDTPFMTSAGACYSPEKLSGGVS